MSVWPPETLGPGEYWIWTTDPSRGTLCIGCSSTRAAAEFGAESEVFDGEWSDEGAEGILEVQVRGASGKVTSWRVRCTTKVEYSAEPVKSEAA
jgi:hypothetical protein